MTIRPLTTQGPPSQWAVLNDYSKTVITLGSALLAATVTFADELLGASASVGQVRLLIAVWGMLLLCILMGVLTFAFLINHLRNQRRENACIFCANAAFFALLAACCLMVGLAWIGLHQRPQYQYTDAKTEAVVTQVLGTMPSVSGLRSSDWLVKSLKWDSATDTCQLVVEDRQSKLKYTLKFNAADARIEDLQNTP